MLDDLKRQAEIDAFQLEAVSTGRCLLICALLLACGLILDALERRAPAPKHTAPASVQSLSHPLCAGREQELKQWGGGEPVNACVSADLRARK